MGNLPGANVTEITANTATGQAWLEYGANQYKGQQFDINTGAAIGSAVSNASHQNFNALTYIGGTQYATGTAATGGTAASALFTLNPSTGTATEIGSGTGINGPVSGIAYNSANSTLYGIEGGTSTPLSLVSINLTTGVATTLFTTGFMAGSLSFAPDGNLYAGSSTGELYSVSPTNQTVTPVLATGYSGAISGLTLGNDTANIPTTVLPSATALPLPTYENSDTFSVAYSASDGTGGSGIAAVSLWYTTDDGSTWTQSNATAAGGAFSYAASADGSYGFYVQATDNAGFADAAPTSAASIQASTLVDTIAPTASAASLPTYETTGTFSVSYAASDSGSGIASVSLWYTSNGGNSWTQSSTTPAGGAFSFTAPAQGSYGFYVQATDNAGNADQVPTTASSIQASTLVDTTAPTASAASLPTYETTGTFTVSYTASDAGSGVASASLWYTTNGGSTWSQSTAPATGGAFAFTTAADGSYGFYVRGIDNAGNADAIPTTAASIQASTLLDTTAPTASASALPSHEATDTFTVSYTATDSGSGVGTVTLWYTTNSGSTWTQSNAPANGGAFTFTTAADGSYGFYVQATDNAGNSDPIPTTGASIQASTLEDALRFSPTSLPVATVGDKFSVPLTPDGGSGLGYTFRGLGLPSWLTLSSTGLLSGTPPATAGAAASFMVTLTDSHKATSTASYTLNIDPALVLSPTTLTVVTVGQPFSTQLTAAGGSGSGYSFTVGSHPVWLTLSASGLLSGTPTSPTSSPFQFTVTATDGNGGTGSHTYSLSVNPALAIRPITLPVATVGDAFSQQLTPTGGSGKGYVFTAPSLPEWLMLSPSGLLSGTPPSTVLSPVSFAVTLTDSNGATISQNYSLTVDPALVLNSGPLPVATVGDVFRQQLTATGGSGTGYRFTLGSHPAWLTVSSTGLLSGTPPATAGAEVNFVVRVTDSHKGSTTTSYTLNIDPALVLSPTTLTVVTVGQPFSTQLSAAGGAGFGYSFSVGSHPVWLTLSANGLLSGMPTTAVGSPFHFTVTATDGIGATGSHTYALSVNPALAIRPITLPVATVGDAFRQQLTPTGGSGKG